MKGFGTSRTILGTPTIRSFRTGAVDAVLIVDTYHEMEDPVGLLRNVARALKPQGRVGFVDYRKEEGGPGPSLTERVHSDEIRRDIDAAGLRVIRSETFLPYQYFLIAGK